VHSGMTGGTVLALVLGSWCLFWGCDILIVRNLDVGLSESYYFAYFFDAQC
jgi:hypothetical protein